MISISGNSSHQVSNEDGRVIDYKQVVTEVFEDSRTERMRNQMKKASLILYLFDLSNGAVEDIRTQVKELGEMGIPYLKVGNKI